MSEAAQSIPPDLYEADEHQWIEEQIAALRTARLDRLDREHLIEFLGDTARSNRHELRNRLTILLIHLLKLRVQRSRASRSWTSSILEQQRQIRRSLEDFLSIRRYVPELLVDAYEDAVRDAAKETGLPPATLPAENPWTLDQALTFDPPGPAERRRAFSD